MLPAFFDNIHNGGDLRNAHAGDNAGGADGSWAHAHFHGVDARINQGFCGFGGHHVACNHVYIRKGISNLAHGFGHHDGMAVGGIQHQHIHPRLDEGGGARGFAFAHADGGAHAQPAHFVGAPVREIAGFDDVFNGKEAFELALFVHNRQFLDAVFMQELLRVFRGGADGHGDQPLLRGHDGGDGDRKILLEAHVPVGENAHQCSGVIGDGDARDMIPRHQLLGIVKGMPRRQGKGVGDDAGLGPLDAVHLGRLVFRGEVFVNDADAAFLRDGDGQPRFRDGIHGRAEQRDV